MAVLILRKDEYGMVLQRCGALCYNSKREYCDCICGGRNHSVGYDQALINSRDMMQTGNHHHQAYFTARVKQGILFPTESGGGEEGTP